MRVLAIGDPHFKADNAEDTDKMLSEILRVIDEQKVDVAVVMGDTLHRHEKIDLLPLVRATHFLREIKNAVDKLIVLIGNHDYPNNKTFMTEEHAFGFLKEWENTVVVDKATFVEHNGVNMLCSPYVPPGRLEEALSTVCSPPYEGMDVVFAHQEFKGAKMNAITSNEGDPWPDEYPMCISGHIHDFDQLQKNLIYTGTPIQHGYGDVSKKSVSIIDITDGNVSHRRVFLNIPRKISVTLSLEQFLEYVPPNDASLRIRVKGLSAKIVSIMKLPHTRSLLNNPKIKIVFVETDNLGVEDLLTPQRSAEVKVSFEQRLRNRINGCDQQIQVSFEHLFG